MATKIPPKYRFTLADRTVAATRSVNPVWKDDLALEYEREQGQMFFRRKLNGKLTFVGADAEWILQRGYSQEIGVTMDRSDDNGVTWSEYWVGHFYMTDCEVNLDDQRIVVQPTVDDAYDKILAGMEKEYNLVELLPETYFVKMKKFPLIQIYYPGETTLSCIYNGMSWEQDVDSETSDSVLQDDFHFYRNSNERELTIRMNGSVYGVYTADVDSEFYNVAFQPISGGAGTYVNVEYKRTLYTQTMIYIYELHIELRKSSDDTVMYSYDEEGVNSIDTSNLAFTMVEVGGSGTAEGQTFTRAIYARILLDVLEFDGTETAPLSPSDFCHDNRNYTRAIGFVLGARYLISSAQTQIQPTAWGKSSNGQYFVEPTASDDVYPIARTSWDNTSVWFVDDGNFIGYMRSMGQKTMVLRTAYPLYSVISVLLHQIDNSLSHAATTAYSKFFYSVTNPVSNQTNRTLLITPKSNLLAGEFSQPAAKAPITLKQVLDMLRDTYQVYWHIDSGKLCLEHISYYKAGENYGAPTLGWDITTMMSRNGEPWGKATSSYKYDKEQMPQTFQFGWMDDCTVAFEGKPIDVLSPYVEQGQIEETRVAMFTSDVDYMLLNPQGISKDGFALMAGTPDNGDYRLSEGQLAPGAFVWLDKYLYLQNFELAFCYLQPWYWLYDMPARSLRVNDASMSANGVRRTKSQEVRFPVYDDPDPLLLVATYLGNGTIEKMSLNLSSRIAKCTLKYEPE